MLCICDMCYCVYKIQLQLPSRDRNQVVILAVEEGINQRGGLIFILLNVVRILRMIRESRNTSHMSCDFNP